MKYNLPFIETDFVPSQSFDQDGKPIFDYTLSLQKFGKHISKDSRTGFNFFRVRQQDLPNVVYGHGSWWSLPNESDEFQITQVEKLIADYFVGCDEPEILLKDMEPKKAYYWHSTENNEVLEASRFVPAGKYASWGAPSETIVRLHLDENLKMISEVVLSASEMPLYTRDQFYLPGSGLVKSLFTKKGIAQTIDYDQFISGLEKSLDDKPKGKV